jgi:3-hydroxyacyl-CoA dehydrogenase
MGAGIARAFIEAGIPAVLLDKNPEMVRTAVANLRRTYERMTAAGRLPAAQAAAQLGLLTAGASVQDLAAVDLVVEAVFEDAEVKKKVLRELESVVREGVPLATNTSYLDINELASVLVDPARVVGIHFFSPAHRAGVLEVIRADQTSADVMDAAFTAARVLNKLPIVARVGDGFIGNRIYNAYRHQCELMVEEGAWPHQVDRAMESFGFAMGPFAVSDMSGLDVAWHMRRNRAVERDPRERYPDVADQLCESGRLGQKTNGGWYRYEPESHSPLPDPLVEDLIRASSARKKLTRRAFSDEEIVGRALMAMANESALVLEDGIADCPSDIDLLLTLGYGFPAHTGGIALWAARQDPAVLAHEQDSLAAISGFGFRQGNLNLVAQTSGKDTSWL